MRQSFETRKGLVFGSWFLGVVVRLKTYHFRNKATALTLAEQGDAAAQCLLGVVYAQGLGVPQDYKEAAKWYRLAAEQGHAAAQRNRGLLPPALASMCP